MNENSDKRTPHSSSRNDWSDLSGATSSSSRLCAVARRAPLRRNRDASPVLRRSLSGTASSSSFSSSTAVLRGMFERLLVFKVFVVAANACGRVTRGLSNNNVTCIIKTTCSIQHVYNNTPSPLPISLPCSCNSTHTW